MNYTQNSSQSQAGIELGVHGAYQQGLSISGYSVLHNEEPKHNVYATQIQNSPMNNHGSIIQQGVIYQTLPQFPHHVMYNNPQNYPNGVFVPAYNTVSYPGAAHLHMNPHQINFLSPQNQAFIVETKIKMDFCCYTCMIYFGLIGSIIALLACIFSENGDPEKIGLDLVLTMARLSTYILAIKAKSNFERKGQYYAFILLCIMTAINLIESIIYLPHTIEFDELFEGASLSMDQEQYEFFKQVTEIIQLVMISLMMIIPLVFNLLLVHYAKAIHDLLKERDRLMNSMFIGMRA